MLTHHLLDSLAVVGPPLRRQTRPGTAAEAARRGIGAAACLGVVMAICCPEVDVTAWTRWPRRRLSSSRWRRACACQPAGVHARVESLAGPYDVVAPRAFASLADLVNWSARRAGPAASGWP